MTFDLLTSGSVHADVLSWTMSTDFGADSSSQNGETWDSEDISS